MKNNILLYMILLVINCINCNYKSEKKDNFDVLDLKLFFNDSTISIWNSSTLNSYSQNIENYKADWQYFVNYHIENRNGFVKAVYEEFKSTYIIRTIYIIEIETFGETNKKINYLFLDGMDSNNLYMFQKKKEWHLVQKGHFDIKKVNLFFEKISNSKICIEDTFKPNHNPNGIITIINKKKIESIVRAPFCTNEISELSEILKITRVKN